MEVNGLNFLSLAESNLVQGEKCYQQFSRTKGPFKDYFCSNVQEEATFCTESRIFSRTPKFEPKTREKPVLVVKPVERIHLSEVNKMSIKI
jgi:hypothetical protein